MDEINAVTLGYLHGDTGKLLEEYLEAIFDGAATPPVLSDYELIDGVPIWR